MAITSHCAEQRLASGSDTNPRLHCGPTLLPGATAAASPSARPAHRDDTQGKQLDRAMQRVPHIGDHIDISKSNSIPLRRGPFSDTRSCFRASRARARAPCMLYS